VLLYSLLLIHFYSKLRVRQGSSANQDIYRLYGFSLSSTDVPFGEMESISLLSLDVKPLNMLVHRNNHILDRAFRESISHFSRAVVTRFWMFWLHRALSTAYWIVSQGLILLWHENHQLPVRKLISLFVHLSLFFAPLSNLLDEAALLLDIPHKFPLEWCSDSTLDFRSS